MFDIIQSANLTVVGPAIVAVAVAALLARLSTSAARYAATTAFAVANCAGLAMKFGPDAFTPSRHWHWMFYVGLVCAAAGWIWQSAQIHSLARWLAVLLASAVSAWLLVPTWETLEPPRLVWVAMLTGYCTLLAAAIGPLERQTGPANLLGLLALSAIGAALLITAALSFTYGRPAGIAAAALAGCFLAACMLRGRIEAGGLVPAYAVVVGGWAFIGCIEPSQPLWSLLLAPAAPLALWASACGPLASLKGLAAAAAQTALVVLALAIAAAIVLL